MESAEIERLASNWFNALLKEPRPAFRGVVQAILGEASARGMAQSPPTYFAVEKGVQHELEQRGWTRLAGYKRALTATPGVVPEEIVARIKKKLNAGLLAESELGHSAIEHVRDVIKPAQSKSAAELCARPLQKLFADFDLFVAQLNTERGIPTFGWKPTSAKMSRFAIYEQGQLSTPEAVQGLIERMFFSPKRKSDTIIKTARQWKRRWST